MPREMDERILKVAEAITDESAVDWQSVDGSDDLESTLSGLKVVADLAGAHRRIRETVDLDWTIPAALRENELFTWGNLRVVEKLGEGGFGEVYRAWEPSLQREVALKLRRAQGNLANPHRWLDEGRRLARVRHPNVVVVHGADQHDDRAGIWTDLLLGKTLEHVLGENGNFSANEATSIAVDLCAALAAVHAADLIHGDVKAANVMREEGGRIVLMDFGSGHEISASDDTLPPSVTPLATAPEVLKGAPLSVQADIYSLGALLYRLVSGRYPVEAASLDELWRKHREEGFTPLRDLRPDLPANFVAAVERAIAMRPEDRFRSVGDLEGALRNAPSAATVTPMPARPAWRRWALAASVVLALGVATVMTLRESSQAPTIAPVQMTATLMRSDFGTREPLRDGDVIAAGQHLSMEVESTEPLHLYILNEDEAGHVYVLFPLPSLSVSNPLPANVRHRVPGQINGAETNWVVTSSSGRERFLTIASREPLAELEAQLASLELAQAGRPVIAAELAMASATELLRGIGGLAAHETYSPASGASVLDGVIQALSGDTDKLWMRHTELSNPGP